MDPDAVPRVSTPSGATSADVAGADRSMSTAARRASAADTLEQLRAELSPELDVLRYIGDESFGSLFLAWESALRRNVVIKVLRREFVDNEEARQRFEREARAAAGIEHANVVTVYRVGKLRNGVPFFTERYTGDCTLRKRLESVGRFQPAEAREILLQLAKALEAAHAAGIVHRDVRLGTVRCREGTNDVLLADFGIAGVLESAGLDEEIITRSGEVIGSVRSMSPEQMHGLHNATDRSDIYSLGVLGWRLLAGASARIPTSDERIDRATLLSVAPDDRALVDLITRCLREHPEDRPSAAVVVRELESARDPANGNRLGQNGEASAPDRRVPVMAAFLVTGALAVISLVSDLFQSGPRLRWLMIATLTAAAMAAAVITWFHGQKGRQTVTRTEISLLGVIAAGLAAAIATVLMQIPPD